MNIEEGSLTISLMGLEELCTTMERCTKANGKMGNIKASANINGLITLHTLEDF